ncbi:MAG: hypothetical protein Ct9H300mP32_0460 [Verrucomicrobiota bacterium]|nr:MAG: hypothetical protein Ct9H300mP32_0460 [Verrucomicrobiota bacterium]
MWISRGVGVICMLAIARRTYQAIAIFKVATCGTIIMNSLPVLGKYVLMGRSQLLALLCPYPLATNPTEYSECEKTVAVSRGQSRPWHGETRH